MENKNIILIILIVIGIILALTLFKNTETFAITGSETMTRTVPASATPSQTFQVVYKTVGATGIYGVSIQDVLSGGCTFTDGTTTLKQVLLNPSTTLTFDVKAPSSGTCTFIGDYKYGEKSLKTFPTATLNVITVKGDTNSDGIVDRTELGIYIDKWITNQVSREDLGIAIQNWASH